MRVAVFIDGKNFYAGYKEAAPGRRVDFPRLAAWLVERVRGSFLWGAYFYTGIETGEAGGTAEQGRLQSFLDMLELQPGFFVHRFPRKFKTSRCPSCQAVSRYSQEKEVDTTMVADMLRLAAVGAFDILVLVSGDQDHAPAIEGVRSLGKQVFVATWSGKGLSARTRRAAFDHIDLLTGVDSFACASRSLAGRVEQSGDEPPERGTPPGPSDLAVEPGVAVVSVNPREQAETSDHEFLTELSRAEQHFGAGFVGANYFVTKWEAPVLTTVPDARRRILDRLLKDGLVEVYAAPDGSKALRRIKR